MAKTVHAPARMRALADSLERAATAGGVAVTRTAIPYGVKLTLVQGAASGVVSIYTSCKVVPNPGAEAHFADVLAALQGAAAPPSRSRGTGTKPANAGAVVGAHDPVTYPYAGSDESGKGDYFGPLVVAAVRVEDVGDDELLRTLGARDSKQLVGIASPRAIAKQIREVCKGRFEEVVILPARYNQLVEELKREGKSSNALLAWAHVTADLPLVAEGKAGLAVADKFGNATYLTKEMKKRGGPKGLELRQETKGERYTAVAAASILARDLCLAWFERADAEVGERLPRGAFDPGIIHVARRLFAKGGIELLGQYAKLHFKTTEKIVGRLPF